jgi:hypothetical protein
LIGTEIYNNIKYKDNIIYALADPKMTHNRASGAMIKKNKKNM